MKRYKYCELCGLGLFSDHGLSLHKSTGRCKRRQADKDMIAVATAEAARLQALKKVRITKVVINALQRRDALEICGAEASDTRYIEGSNAVDSYLLEEWWVYDWVAALYQAHKYPSRTAAFAKGVQPGSSKFYSIIEDLVKLPEVERQGRINLIVMGYLT